MTTSRPPGPAASSARAGAANHRKPSLAAFAVTFALLLAGCVGSSNGPTENDRAQGGAPPATPVGGSGSISGQVVDEEILPVAGAAVEVSGPMELSAVTDAEGMFTFNSLDPGSYRLQVQKVGYKISTQTIGIARDRVETVFVSLEAIPVAVPRYATYVADGHIELGAGVALGYTFNLTGDQATTVRYPLEPDAVASVALMEWGPSLPGTAGRMFLSLWAAQAQSDRLVRSDGPSPLLARSDGVGEKIQGQSGWELMTYWGPSTCGADTETCSQAPDTIVSLVVDQRYKVYTSIFYVDKPPPAFDPAAQ